MRAFPHPCPARRAVAATIFLALTFGLLASVLADEPPAELNVLPDEESVPQTTVELLVGDHKGDAASLDKALQGLLAEFRSQAEKLKGAYDTLAAEKDAAPAAVDAARDALAFAQEQEQLLSREVALLSDQRALHAARTALEKEKEGLAAADAALEKFLAALGARKVDGAEVQLTAREASGWEERLEEAKKATEAAAEDVRTADREIEHFTISRSVRRGEHKDLIAAYSEAAGQEKAHLQKKLTVLVERVKLLQEARSFLASRRSYVSALLDLAELKVRLATRAAALARRKADAVSAHLAQQVAIEEQKNVEEEKARLDDEGRRLSDQMLKAQSPQEKERLTEQQFHLQIRQRINDIRAGVARWKKQRGEFIALTSGPRREAVRLERAALEEKPLDAAAFIEKKKALDQEIGQNSIALEGLAQSLREAKSRLDALKGEREPALEGVERRIKEEQDRRAATADAGGDAAERSRALAATDAEIARLKALREERTGLLVRELSAQQDHVNAVEEYRKDVEGHIALLSKWRDELVERHARLTTLFLGFEIPYPPYVAAPGMVGILLLVLLILNLPVRRLFVAWARRTEGTLDDNLVALFIRYANIGLILATGYVLVNVLPLPERAVQLANKTLLVFAIAAAFMVLGKAVLLIIEGFLARYRGTSTIVGPVRTIIKIVFFSVAIMVILDSLNVSIAPLLATLGVGSIAIALALQDTLSNLFAGVYVVADRPIAIGDYIRIDNGMEGFVVQISWRTTRIRDLTNNIIIIPNAKLSQSVITNYNLPEPRMGVSLGVTVANTHDPDKVEAVIAEVARAAATSGEIEGLLADPLPIVRFSPGFADSSLGYTVVYSVRSFVDQEAVAAELRKRIARRFREQGIALR